MIRIAVQKFLKRGTCLVRIVEIVFVDFADGEQRVKAILTARIFAAQEFVLSDGAVQNPFVFEAAPHLDQCLGHSHYAGIGFSRGGRYEIKRAGGNWYAP